MSEIQAPPRRPEAALVGGGAELARALGLVLDEAGVRLTPAPSPAALIELLAGGSRRPDCLLLDLGPERPGRFALFDRLRALPSAQDLPIVLLTEGFLTEKDCLAHGALYRVAKVSAATELVPTLRAVLAQHDRSRGVLSVGDLRLDPRDRLVTLAGAPLARLSPGHFAALHRLVASSPRPISDEELYARFLERHAYHTPDNELAVHATLKNYVSRLRRELGPAVASRIVRRRDGGYAYEPARPKVYLK